VVIEPKNKEILTTNISKKRYVYCQTISVTCSKQNGLHAVSSDGGGTWYPQACRFLKLVHHLHSFVYQDEKSIIERTMQYKNIKIKDFIIIFLARERNVN
jgi:putative transposase